MLATAAGQHREWDQSSASCVKLAARPSRSASLLGTLSRVRINLRGRDGHHGFEQKF